MPERRIAVVGAAGFVGRELLRQLEERGVRATAVVRALAELAVDGDFHKSVLTADVEPASFDVVVNLAYPTSGAPFEQPEQNAAIIDSVSRLVRDGGRVIQVSTMAVFGMTLDTAPHPGPVKRRRDLVYVEGKIEAEHAFASLQRTRGLSVDIVRLGNVWGAGSGAWALLFVRRLLTGRPVGVAGSPGYSNATDVVNVANYLAHLLVSPRAVEIRYHHLAEFSSVRWGDWLEPLAAHMGVEPVLAGPDWLAGPGSLAAEVAESVVPGGVRSVHMRLAEERVGGSLARSAIRRLPRRVQPRLRSNLVVAAAPSLGRIDQVVLKIMAGESEFPSHLDPAWQPPLSREESLERVVKWLDED